MPRPFVPAANTLQVNMRYLQANEPVENVYWVQGTAPWTLATMQAIATSFHDWESSNMSALRHQNVLHYQTHVRDFTTQNGLVLDSASALGGTLVGVALPNSCTVAVKMATGLSGRSFRGRSYFIGLEDSQVFDAQTPNILKASFVTALASAYNFLLAIPFTNSAKLVVASFRHDNAWRAAAVLTPVTNFSLVDSFVDNQRRRLPGHNRHR